MKHVHDHHQAPGGSAWGDLGSALELDGEVLSPVLAEAIKWLQALSDQHEVARILDLGCGPGVATCQLANAFPGASVVAVDGSAELLDRVRTRALRHGVDDRVTTVEANIEAGVGDLGPADIVWAAMVLHHVKDIASGLDGVLAALRPGGLLALAEFGTPTRILPDETGLTWPGLDGRLHQAHESVLDQTFPGGHASVDWPAALTQAGFQFLGARDCPVDIPAPLPVPERMWVTQLLRRIRELAHETLGSDDQAALEVLVDPNHPAGAMHRPDVFIQTSRKVVIVQRPQGPAA